MTLEEIHWALVELQGLGYVERTGPDNWHMTPSGHQAARSFLQSLRTADRVLLIVHMEEPDEGLDIARR